MFPWLVLLVPALLPTSLSLSLRMSSKSNVVIIGSGPTGLAAAIMLARGGFTGIKVFDRLSQPPSPSDASVWANFVNPRSYNIGLSSRGQNALIELGVLNTIMKYTVDVVGRKDWSPETKIDEPIETVYTDRTYPTRVLQRDRLAGALLEEILDKYKDAVEVSFKTECESIQWLNLGKADERCRLTLKDTSGGAPLFSYVESPLVIGADGANSVIRESMAKTSPKHQFRIRSFEDKNVRVYRTIPLHFPNDPKKWRKDLNWSVRLKSDINMDALPTKEGVFLGVVLYRPWDDRINSLRTKEDAKTFFNTYFPMFTPCLKLEDMERFAQMKPSKFTRFSYCGPKLHKGKSTVLLGDCIHTVKPFFGLGVNSAFEDVTTLGRSLEKHNYDISKALEDYSKSRAPETKALVTMSKQLDGGFLLFILPLILDSILHKAFPFIFSPNTISSMQNEKKTFVQVARRKFMDRIMQLALLSTILTGISRFIMLSLRAARAVLSLKR